MNALALEIVLNFKKVLGNPTEVIPLHELRFGNNVSSQVQECIESTTFVSSERKFVDRFETSMAEYKGAKHVAAVVNGTRWRQGALSFNGNKTITTGGGGAILTLDLKLHDTPST